VTLLTTPSVNKDSGILEYSTNQFFKPKILSFKDCDGDKFLSNINMKLKNNKKLTSDEYIQLGLVPLMYSKHEASEQILKTIETTRKIKNMDNDFKKEILGVQAILADKFVEDSDLKNQIIDVIYMDLDIIHDFGLYKEKQGMTEGKTEEKINIAKNMIKENYSISEIMKITDLSNECIKNLKYK
jgi:hypothetical protein